MFHQKTILLLAFALVISSCQKDEANHSQLPVYQWLDNDQSGGEWIPVYIPSNQAFTVATPEETGSVAYKQEFDAMKAALQNMTDADREAADYWTANPLLRWNEIARDLAAKYNLAPAPNAEGVYKAPDAANPSAYPNFPFAHPPYTSRMLAYLQVAVFDAMVHTWKLKYQFNRPSTSDHDANLQPYFGKSGLPSYPSDGAVVTGVAKTVLTAMFPLEKTYIEDKANQHLAVLKFTGTNVQSDITAGSALGTEAAGLVLKRAGTDGMKNAQTPKPISDSLKMAAFTRFNWQWNNLETPPRPVGITPYFGKVKCWSTNDITTVRPPVPPAPGSAEFKIASDELISIQENMTPEQRKIAIFWADGTSTYTPPGHWNRLACDFITESKMNPLRSARTLAYLNMAIQDAGIACWDAKYYYHYPRPIQGIENFKTILGTPNFPSYTSGHSTFSGAAATVLSHFFPAKATQCQAWAKEASESRIYGGIHYRFDCEEGLIAGNKVGNLVLNIAKVDGGE